MGLYLFEGTFPSAKFSKDVQKLGSLSSDGLYKLVEWFKSLENISEITNNDVKKIEKLSLGQDITTAISITRFILRKWELLNLSIDMLIEDFKTIELEEDITKKLYTYFQELETIKHKTYINYLESRESRLGIPVISDVNVSWNMRAIFAEHKSEEFYGELLEEDMFLL